MTQPDPATRAERRKALTKMYEDEMAVEAASPAALTGMTRMGLEVASAYRYIDSQEDFGPMTREVLKGIIRKVAEAAISDVEDFVARLTEQEERHDR